MTQSAPQVPGFQVTSLLGQGAMSNVFRAVREGQPYAIKVMRADRQQHDVEAALRFRREAAAIARLDHPGLVKVIEVGETQGQPFLVMELVEGESLEQRLRRGPLSEPELMSAARSVATALSEVHRHGLVHRDLKPANIILLPSGQAKVIDFGFVGQVAEDGSGANDQDNEVLGTFLYAAPEQSGMLKRKVDSRADLYALGCILFECATGSPPFKAQNLAELLHMHAAVRAPDAHQVNPSVRPVLALILQKLLAKDPDDRYQTCAGLLADLENLPELEAAHKFGRPAPLGQRDVQVAGFEVPLVGRATEMSALGKYWAQAKAGQGAMIQLEGEGGSGKTRLVRELIKLSRAEGALIMTGKAQQGERTPFGPLREAVESYLSAISRMAAEPQKQALQRVKEAAGEFGGIVKRLSRALEPVFADAKDLPPMDPLGEQLRFYEKVAEFFANIAKANGSCVLLVDDVQWLDDGTTEVLHRLVPKTHELPLLILTAARNDPQSEAARQAFVRKMGAELAERFPLGPLDSKSVSELIAAHLGGKPLEPAVVEKINARARGNPFALGEYVRSLLDEGMIRPTFGAWAVDSSRFHEAALSKDVIQLLVNRVQALSEGTRNVLATASVIGFEFGTALLTDAMGGKADAVRRALEEALRAGLVERADAGFRFIHDRVHEAITASLTQPQSRDINQAVAQAIEATGDRSGPTLHALARHYARGHAEKHQDKIYETSLRAGVNALETFSNPEAVDLLSRAYRAGEIVGISPESKAMISELLGVACTRTGKLDVALNHLRHALSSAKSDDDRSRIHFLIGNAFSSKARYPDAKVELDLALRLKGSAMPKSPPLMILSLLGTLIRVWFRSRTGLGYGSAKGEERQRREAVSTVQVAVRVLAYFLNDPLLLVYMSLRELLNGHFLGTSRELAKAYSVWAVGLAVLGMAKPAQKNAKMSVAMARQLGDPETLAYCETYSATAQDMWGDLPGGQKAHLEAIPGLLRYGASFDQVGFVTHHMIGVMAQGRAREAIDWALNHLDVVNKSGSDGFQTAIFSSLYSQLTILGRIPDAVKARDQARRIVEVSGTVHGKMALLCNTIWALHEQSDYGPELEKAITDLHKLGIDEYQNRHGYLAAAYVRLEQLAKAQGRDAQKKARVALKVAIAEACFPPPMIKAPVWQEHIKIINAAVARLDKQYRKARGLLDEATELANAAQSVWGKWLIARERARLAAAKNDEQTCRRQVELAITMARREGWVGRVNSLEREFGSLARPQAAVQEPQNESIVTQPLPQGLAASSPAGSQWFSSRTGSKVRMIEIERQMEALLQVSLATASSLDPAEQARAALDELVMLLGAERAFLFAADPVRGGLEMQAGRDAEKKDVLALSGFSSTVVNKAYNTGEALVVSGTDEGEALGAESIAAHNLRSIMAAPLMLRDQKLGVVYLDSRLAKGMFGKQHLRILQPICNFIAISLQTGRMARVEATQKAMEKDLQLTAAVQSLFLPKQGTARNQAVGVSGYYRPAAQCGGDWWWYEPIGENGMRVFLGDVTGHGAASAMVTASVASAFQFLRRTATGRKTAELVSELGQHLRNTTDGAYYMTFSAVEVDGEGRKLRWWNAGSPPLFIRRKTGEIEVLNLPGAPLGSSGAPPGFAETDVAPGERILVFTDGVSELNLPNKKQLGFKRLSKFFAETSGVPVEEAVNVLATRLDAVRQNTPQEDDITFAVMDVL